MYEIKHLQDKYICTFSISSVRGLIFTWTNTKNLAIMHNHFIFTYRHGGFDFVETNVVRAVVYVTVIMDIT